MMDRIAENIIIMQIKFSRVTRKEKKLILTI